MFNHLRDFVLYSCLTAVVAQNLTIQAQPRCDDDDDGSALPEKLQAALSACQRDLESLITHGFFHGLADVLRIEKEVRQRSKRGTSHPGRQEIAGCMLLCMFRKLKMVDEDEVPTVEGLTKYLGEGVKQRGQFLAVTQAVQQCVSIGRKEATESDKATYKCVVSYRIFDCIRNQIMDYCRGS